MVQENIAEPAAMVVSAFQAEILVVIEILVPGMGSRS
jgi:hypothetical protein